MFVSPVDIERPVHQPPEIPPAFYRDSNDPPPPPDDPHWREWPHDDHEHAPAWLVYGLPAFLVVFTLFHFALFWLIVSQL